MQCVLPIELHVIDTLKTMLTPGGFECIFLVAFGELVADPLDTLQSERRSRDLLLAILHDQDCIASVFASVLNLVNATTHVFH